MKFVLTSLDNSNYFVKMTQQLGSLICVKAHTSLVPARGLVEAWSESKGNSPSFVLL